MKTITLTDAEYNELVSELRALEIYRWNDSRISAVASPSKVLPVIERRAFNIGSSAEAEARLFKPNPPPVTGIMLLEPVAPGVTIEPIPLREVEWLKTPVSEAAAIYGRTNE